MSHAGYYRQPTIAGDTIIFVCEGDLWAVPVSRCVAREEAHPEVYVMPADGGDATRLTYLGSEVCNVVGWTPDGNEILFVSDGRSPFLRHTDGFAVPRDGGSTRSLNFGHMLAIDIAKNGGTLIGRNNNDPARWKRYHGGTAGGVWARR